MVGLHSAVQHLGRHRGSPACSHCGSVVSVRHCRRSFRGWTQFGRTRSPLDQGLGSPQQIAISGSESNQNPWSDKRSWSRLMLRSHSGCRAHVRAQWPRCGAKNPVAGRCGPSRRCRHAASGHYLADPHIDRPVSAHRQVRDRRQS